MQFTPMPIEIWCILGIRRCFLVYDNLTGVILVNIEAVTCQINLFGLILAVSHLVDGI